MAFVIKYEVTEGKGSYLATKDFPPKLPRFGATLAATPRFATMREASDVIHLRMPLVAAACCEIEEVP